MHDKKSNRSLGPPRDHRDKVLSWRSDGFSTSAIDIDAPLEVTLWYPGAAATKARTKGVGRGVRAIVSQYAREKKQITATRVGIPSPSVGDSCRGGPEFVHSFPEGQVPLARARSHVTDFYPCIFGRNA